MTEAIYDRSEDEILKYFITEEMDKNHFAPSSDLPAVARKKTVFTVIFAVLTFLFVSAYFFHFLHRIYLLELVNIAAYLYIMRKFNTMRHLIKEVKSRPDEEIAYIVSSMVASGGKQKGGTRLRVILFAGSVLLPLILFMVPHVMYERVEDGYYVRFYTRGVIQTNSIEIPETHKGEPVVGIRGNVFANLPGVDSIWLPDSVDVIRGHAFAFSKDLDTVRMPETLSYLGGNAFEDCTNLWDVKLPYGLTEIKGSTFEGCSFLESVDIPEGVTRIGAHAFRGCSRLYSVTVPSTVEEIGSSAFRDCEDLWDISVPEDTVIDERAFKNSPTDVYYY